MFRILNNHCNEESQSIKCNIVARTKDVCSAGGTCATLVSPHFPTAPLNHALTSARQEHRYPPRVAAALIYSDLSEGRQLTHSFTINTMSEQLEVKDAHRVDESSFPYIFEENAVVPLKTTSRGIIRCNVYRPKSTKDGAKLPVLVTYGPYGKDIHYKE